MVPPLSVFRGFCPVALSGAARIAASAARGARFRHAGLLRLFCAAAFLFFAGVCAGAPPKGYPLRGRVIDRLSRRPVPYAAVVVVGQEQRGAPTDSAGLFLIEGVAPGICRLSVTSLGYGPLLSPEYVVSASAPFVELEMEEDPGSLEAVTVTPSPFRRTTESPVGMKVIGLREIEKSPGSNRDIARIVRSYPGVSFSPAGYRNDLIVRGGGPSENVFFMDGIEIPNINHFATQGASGGPVSIVNADLVREISFHTGAFPANRAGAMSSVLDFRLRDGDPERRRFKATVGASEVGVSGSGPVGDRTTYLFSVRRSYLQLLFKMLGLPFLPDYIDAQVKIRSRISERDELTVMALAGIDDMRLNTDEKGEDAEYLLGYLPRLKQETWTAGASWRRYAGPHAMTLTLSHSYLNNRNIKYAGNDSSTEEHLMLRLRAVEQKSTLRFENRTHAGRWTLRAGAELRRRSYDNATRRRVYFGEASMEEYRTSIAFAEWGCFLGADYAAPSGALTLSAGMRMDGSSYSPRTARFWEQFSPRLSLAWSPAPSWTVSGSAGIYCQLPPLTALGFRDETGALVNRTLRYMRSLQGALGAEWRLRDRLCVSMEGFYKHYDRVPLSLADGVPLTCKGDDYGTVGDEALVPSACGRAYGVEWMVRWQIPGRFHLVGSFTLYRSLYGADAHAPLVPSAWDNRFVLNVSGVVDLPRSWSLGAKLSAIGGAPYTPYDELKSSLCDVWNTLGRPAYDYSRYNTGRLPSFAQLDLRVDKTFYFRSWALGLYLDLQNVTGAKLRQPDVLLSTGEVVNPSAPSSEQRYAMKRLARESGTLLPSVGITVEF